MKRFLVPGVLAILVGCLGGGGGGTPDGGGEIDGTEVDASDAEPPGCLPSTCDGCCDGDVCSSGNVDDACGQGGAECFSCVTVGAECVDRECVAPCGPETCAGCCAGGVCLDGTSVDACGEGGETCTDCGTDVCDSGTCLAQACTDTCGGCCDVDGCHLGTAPDACGTAGEACTSCGPNSICENGHCTLDPNSRWDIVIWDGSIHPVNWQDESWDPFGGLPDPCVGMLIRLGPTDFSGTTPCLPNTLTPLWNWMTLGDLPAFVLLEEIGVTAADDDFNDDDFIGFCIMKLDESDFTNTLLTFDCPRSKDGNAGFTIHFRVRPH
jgi:hypothetical protein